MKSFSLFFLVLTCPIVLFSQWYWQRPDPTGVDLNDVYLLNEDDAWAVGEGGVIIISESGGYSWQQKYTPKIVGLNSVHIVNAGNVWICGDEGCLFRSSISAISFNTTIINSDASYDCIFFISEQLGWVAGTDGIYNTTDGGMYWTQQYSSDSINEIEFYDENIGYAVGEQGIILRTLNGGTDWIECSCPAGFSPNAVSLATQDIIWVIGNGSEAIIRSTDGGQTWETMSCPTSHQIADIDFADEYFGWIVGENGIILKTDNAGSSWTQLITGDYDNHNALSFSNVYNGIIVGNGGKVFSSDDGGGSWARITEPENTAMEFFTSIQFIDHRGWIGNAYSNYILRTTSGGYGWSKHELDQSANVRDIFFIDHLKGWAGTMGGIERTADGGISWDYIHDLNDCITIWFFDHYNGFAGTHSGFLRTSDGGDSFTEAGLNSEGFIYSIFFINSSKGWLASSEGEIFYTSDGGDNWILQNTPTSDELVKVYFLDEDLGWACGIGGLLHTSDGGNTWYWQYTTTGPIQDVFFLDPDNGYIAYGSIFATTDGGNTWEDQFSGSDVATIYAFSFPESTTAYACGNNATVLKTVNGGFVNIEDAVDAGKESNALLYPNPVKDKFTIEYKLESRSVIDVLIFNSRGQLVKSTSVYRERGENSQEFSLKNQRSGIYFYVIKGNGFSSSGKLIKY